MIGQVASIARRAHRRIYSGCERDACAFRHMGL
jgi:hypothetical protein